MKNIRVWILDANSAVNKNRFSTAKGAVEKKYSVFEQSADTMTPCLETLVLRRRGI